VHRIFDRRWFVPHARRHGLFRPALGFSHHEQRLERQGSFVHCTRCMAVPRFHAERHAASPPPRSFRFGTPRSCGCSGARCGAIDFAPALVIEGPRPHLSFGHSRPAPGKTYLPAASVMA
jgi:hypothetical protein